MSDLVYLVFCTLGAMVVMVQSFVSVNRMSVSTDHIIRIAYLLLCAGSFGEVAMIFHGHVPCMAESMFVGGSGLLAIRDRRTLRCPFDPSLKGSVK